MSQVRSVVSIRDVVLSLGVGARAAYRRILAPILCRPAGLRLYGPFPGIRVGPVAGDLAKARIYSDEPFDLGDRLKLAILAGGKLSRKFVAEVVWLEEQPERAAARFDVGLQIERIDPSTAELLRSVMG